MNKKIKPLSVKALAEWDYRNGLTPSIARQAVDESIEMLRKQHEQGIFDDGDPNHPKHNNGINYATGLPVSLFGYDVKEFMAKQH